MIVSELRLYDLLKAKIGEKEAEAFVEILENKVDEKFSDAKQHLATKEDLANVKVELGNVKADIIKWMFIFWVGSIFSILGGLYVFLKMFLDK